VLVAGVPKDRPVVVVAVTEGARDRGLKAGALVGVAAKTLGGGGGGKDDLAQGGGANPAAVADALTAVEHAVATA
jgi:alanyl-tRNA synthetase